MDNQRLWQNVLTELQLTLSRPIFSAWFKSTKIENIKKINKNEQLVKISVPNPFIQETINKRYQDQVIKILNRITGVENRLFLEVKQISEKRAKVKPLGPLFSKDLEKEKENIILSAIRKAGLREDFTFENFAVSSTNEMAYAASQSVAQNPGKTYQLLFLYGGVGVGKTHLMHAIAREILERNPQILIIYCTGEEFTNEIIQAIRTKSTQAFREKYRTVKMLLIDDIQFIGGKEAVQEEFFHTFNTIHRNKGQVILTSDRLPHEIKGLADRLRSRFEGGLSIDIQQPNFELRTAILLIKSRQWNRPLPMDVAQIIADRIESTRALEGFLMRLITECDSKGEPFTPDIALSLLGKSKEEKKITKTLNPIEIVAEVADYFKIKEAVLKGPKRDQSIVVPRQLAMFLLRIDLKLSLEKIGQFFGNRDHTTVMHSVDKISKQMAISESLRLDISAIRKKIFIL